MGMKKEVLQRALGRLMAKGRRDPRWVKKMVAFTLACTLLLMVSCGLLLYFAVGMAKNLVADRPDLDLLAMEQLIAEKSLTLSEEQQRLLAPIIATLAVSDLASEQATTLKTQLLNTISPAQLDKMSAWKNTATSKAEGFLALSPAVAATIAEYTGLSKEIVATRINAFLAWWQPTKPENSAEQLQKTMRSL